MEAPVLIQWWVPLTFVELRRVRSLLRLYGVSGPAMRGLDGKLAAAEAAIGRWNARREHGTQTESGAGDASMV
jgi:hypothetical protein